MTLTQHLTELRTRLMYSVVIIFVAFFFSYSQGELIQEVLLAPLKSHLPNGGQIVFLGILDKVLTQFQLALWSALVLSSPFLFHQAWLFIRPGLYDHEAKIALPFTVMGFLLFLSGVGFGYFIVFPYTFETLLNFGVQGIEATLSLKEYITLSVKVLILLGILFQLPNLMLILQAINLVRHKDLAMARRYVVSFFAVFSAMITPPDVITMLALWLPMVLLYEFGLLLVYFSDRLFKRPKDLTTTSQDF